MNKLGNLCFYMIGNYKFTRNLEVQMKEMTYVLIFLGIYILVQVYILPKMGIST